MYSAEDSVKPTLPARSGGPRERLGHALASALANLVVQKPSSEVLRFGLIKDAAGLEEVGRMRLRVYQARLSYLVQELSAQGLDAYDSSSFVFAVWRGGEVVATLRATRYPYETLHYVPGPELSSWLKKGWDTDYLEWGRLLVDDSKSQRLNRLTPSLITYAGLYLLLLTPYRKFFGYARAQPSRSFGGFLWESSPGGFSIPHRGEHKYQLLKGALLKSATHSVPRWLAAAGQRLLAKVGRPRAALPVSSSTVVDSTSSK